MALFLFYTHKIILFWVLAHFLLSLTLTFPSVSWFRRYEDIFLISIPTKLIFLGYPWPFFFSIPTLYPPGQYSVGILGSFSSPYPLYAHQVDILWVFLTLFFPIPTPYPPGRYSVGILDSFSSPYPLHAHQFDILRVFLALFLLHAHQVDIPWVSLALFLLYTHQVDIPWVFLALFLLHTHSIPTKSIFCGYGGQLCITIPAHSPLARSVALSLPHTHIPFHLYFPMPGNLHCDSSIILSAEIMGTAGCQAFQCFRVRMSVRIISSSRKQSYLRLQ